MGTVPFPDESPYKKIWHFSNSSLNWCTRTYIRHSATAWRLFKRHHNCWILAKYVLMKVIRQYISYQRSFNGNFLIDLALRNILLVWISSFRKVDPSLWFTNRGEWFRQNYGIVWIINCWNGLFGVSKPHQKGKVLYWSCSLCHVLTISISPREK